METNPRKDDLETLANIILNHLTGEDYHNDHDLADVLYDAACKLNLVQWNGDKLVRL